LISRGDSLPPLPVADLAAEVAANRNLLCALAGPAISLTVDAVGAALPVRLSGEDLTRVLVNLVKNAAEAMPDGGRIHIELRERAAAAGGSTCLMLAIEDSGPGIPGEAGEQIFDRGFTTHGKGSGNEASPGSGRPENAKNGKPANGNPPNGQSPENGLGPDDAWPFSHRGLGLAITRSIVEASGGHICAVIPCEGGARFEIELPLRHDTAPMAACSS
jgi:signal transduction histidine kinase